MIRHLLIGLMLGLFAFGGYLSYTAVTLPNVRKALEEGIEPSQTSQIFARDKSVLMAYGRFQYKPVSLSKISPFLIDALLATEDRRFFEHHGIDPIGVARALVSNVMQKDIHQGASTLTQQLARNIFLSQERSFERKIKEALLAIKLEHQLSKQEILELYLNNIYFGEGAYGVGAASMIYFGTTPDKLTKPQAALIAGLPQAPSVYSPYINQNLAIKRRNEVLHNLLEIGKLTQEEYDVLASQPIYVNDRQKATSGAGLGQFFSRYVLQRVCQLLDMDEQTFWQQGLKIYTTLDPRAQKIAETQIRLLSIQSKRTSIKQQAALVSLDSRGRMIAYVGGKDFSKSQFDRVVHAKRQAGSLFKVFVYTTAIQEKYSPLTVYKDEPVEFEEQEGWKPENYDKKHRGYMTLAGALAMSNNVIAAKLIRDLTPEAVVAMAHKMGIESSISPNLSLALGAADVSLKEITSAYSVFPNEGFWVQPYAIDKIIDKTGQVVYQHEPKYRTVVKRPVRDMMIAMMQGVMKYGTGKGAQIGRPAAGKTGTSDDYRDAWFVGYTPELTTGVWVGNDDNSKMLGITGGSLPAAIWKAYMTKLLEATPVHEFELANTPPLEQNDFFVYDLANLSESEKNEGQSTEVPTGDPPITDTQNQQNPEAASGSSPSENKNTGQTPFDNPEGIPLPESEPSSPPSSSTSDYKTGRLPDPLETFVVAPKPTAKSSSASQSQPLRPTPPSSAPTGNSPNLVPLQQQQGRRFSNQTVEPSGASEPRRF